ncbi:hypothetical protein B0H13DRAFT_2339731 [Mycena leptocephala]|nr:hypothetical protein B0H13DRAFT_2339731 [Mycena leptocephala]
MYYCNPPLHADVGFDMGTATGFWMVTNNECRSPGPGLYTSWASALAVCAGIESVEPVFHETVALALPSWYECCRLGEHAHPIDPLSVSPWKQGPGAPSGQAYSNTRHGIGINRDAAPPRQWPPEPWLLGLRTLTLAPPQCSRADGLNYAVRGGEVVYSAIGPAFEHYERAVFFASGLNERDAEKSSRIHAKPRSVSAHSAQSSPVGRDPVTPTPLPRDAAKPGPSSSVARLQAIQGSLQGQSKVSPAEKKQASLARLVAIQGAAESSHASEAGEAGGGKAGDARDEREVLGKGKAKAGTGYESDDFYTDDDDDFAHLVESWASNTDTYIHEGQPRYEESSTPASKISPVTTFEVFLAVPPLCPSTPRTIPIDLEEWHVVGESNIALGPTTGPTDHTPTASKRGKAAPKKKKTAAVTAPLNEETDEPEDTAQTASINDPDDQEDTALQMDEGMEEGLGLLFEEDLSEPPADPLIQMSPSPIPLLPSDGPPVEHEMPLPVKKDLPAPSQPVEQAGPAPPPLVEQDGPPLPRVEQEGPAPAPPVKQDGPALPPAVEQERPAPPPPQDGPAPPPPVDQGGPAPPLPVDQGGPAPPPPVKQDGPVLPRPSMKVARRLPRPSIKVVVHLPRALSKMVPHLPRSSIKKRRHLSLPSMEVSCHRLHLRQWGANVLPPPPPPPLRENVRHPLHQCPATTSTSASGGRIAGECPTTTSTNVPPPAPPVEQEKGRSPSAPAANPHAKPVGDPVTLDGATWADRNAEAPKNPVQERIKVPLGEAEKASQKERRKQKAEEEEAYQIALTDFDLEMDAKAEEIAEKFHKEVDNVKRGFGRTEVNDVLPAGAKHHMRDLQNMVREDARFQNMTDKDEEVLIAEFEARPDKKVVGTRLSNAAAARDVTAFTKRVHHELCSLQKRTGAIGVCVIGRSSVSDTLVPACVGPEEATQYFPQVLRSTSDQFALKFDHYTVNRGVAALDLGSNEMRKAVTDGISDALEQRLGRKVTMKYGEYDQLVATYGVELLGWPEGLPFQSPSNLATLERLKPLYDALQANTLRRRNDAKNAATRTCHVKKAAKSKETASNKRKKNDDSDVDEGDQRPKRIKKAVLAKMTPEEKTEHRRKMERDRKARNRCVQAEKEGKEIKKRKRGSTNDDESGKAKRAQKSGKSSVKSASTIDDDDDDDYEPATKKKGKAKAKATPSEDEDKDEDEDHDEGESDPDRGNGSREGSFGPKPSKKYLAITAAVQRGKQNKISVARPRRRSPSNHPVASTSQLPPQTLNGIANIESDDDEEEDGGSAHP